MNNWGRSAVTAIVIPLQQAILKATEREQERIGQELHDGLGQHLTGVAFLAKALAHKLADQGVPEAADAEQLVQLINRSVSMTRGLAHGLRPVGEEDNALMVALRQLAIDVSDLFKVPCRFINDEPVLIRSPFVAHHLFRVAQEAVNNALKHGDPSLIEIELERKSHRSSPDTVLLRVSNNGTPFAQGADASGGMGLAGMRYRAKLIGAKFALRRDRKPKVGVTVTIDDDIAQTLKEPIEHGDHEHE